jgi:excisionase family DNA binding protein
MPQIIEGVTFYNIREIATKLQVTPQTIRKMIKQGKLPAQRYGRPMVISDQQFKDFLITSIKARPTKEPAAAV